MIILLPSFGHRSINILVSMEFYISQHFRFCVDAIGHSFILFLCFVQIQHLRHVINPDETAQPFHGVLRISSHFSKADIDLAGWRNSCQKA